MKANQKTKTKFSSFQTAAEALAVKDYAVFSNKFSVHYSDNDSLEVKIKETGKEVGGLYQVVVVVKVYENFYS